MSKAQLPLPLPSNDTMTAPVDDARNPHVRRGVDYWRSVCLQRRFPARGDLTLRGLATVLPYAVIIGVIDEGADYEFRYVGDAQRQAFKVHFKGLRLTQITAAAPELGTLLRGAYEFVRSTGTAFVVRGRVDHEPADSKFLYHESAFLPLGATDASVDHLLIVGVQIPTPFWEIPTDKLTTLADQSRQQTATA